MFTFSNYIRIKEKIYFERNSSFSPILPHTRVLSLLRASIDHLSAIFFPAKKSLACPTQHSSRWMARRENFEIKTEVFNYIDSLRPSPPIFHPFHNRQQCRWLIDKPPSSLRSPIRRHRRPSTTFGHFSSPAALLRPRVSAREWTIRAMATHYLPRSSN